VSNSAEINDIEEGLALQPKFDASGLVTCVATDAATGEVLMVAHMNDEALRRTIASGQAWYFSRSRQALWRKGESSGNIQRVVEMRLDCDQDAIWIRVEQTGAACHTGRRSCSRRRRAIELRRRRPAVRSDGGLPQVGAVAIRGELSVPADAFVTTRRPATRRPPTTRRQSVKQVFGQYGISLIPELPRSPLEAL
jgi:phosphoribosyl-AMP cyclohydrolase